MSGRLHHFIGGAKVDGGNGRAGVVFNPATGEIHAEAPYADAAEVDRAVGAACAARAGWASASASARSQIMFRFR